MDVDRSTLVHQVRVEFQLHRARYRAAHFAPARGDFRARQAARLRWGQLDSDFTQVRLARASRAARETLGLLDEGLVSHRRQHMEQNLVPGFFLDLALQLQRAALDLLDCCLGDVGRRFKRHRQRSADEIVLHLREEYELDVAAADKADREQQYADRRRDSQVTPLQRNPEKGAEHFPRKPHHPVAEEVEEAVPNPNDNMPPTGRRLPAAIGKVVRQNKLRLDQ